MSLRSGGLYSRRSWHGQCASASNVEGPPEAIIASVRSQSLGEDVKGPVASEGEANVRPTLRYQGRGGYRPSGPTAFSKRRGAALGKSIPVSLEGTGLETREWRAISAAHTLRTWGISRFSLTDRAAQARQGRFQVAAFSNRDVDGEPRLRDRGVECQGGPDLPVRTSRPNIRQHPTAMARHASTGECIAGQATGGGLTYPQRGTSKW